MSRRSEVPVPPQAPIERNPDESGVTSLSARDRRSRESRLPSLPPAPEETVEWGGAEEFDIPIADVKTTDERVPTLEERRAARKQQEKAWIKEVRTNPVFVGHPLAYPYKPDSYDDIESERLDDVFETFHRRQGKWDSLPPVSASAPITLESRIVSRNDVRKSADRDRELRAKIEAASGALAEARAKRQVEENADLYDAMLRMDQRIKEKRQEKMDLVRRQEQERKEKILQKFDDLMGTEFAVHELSSEDVEEVVEELPSRYLQALPPELPPVKSKKGPPPITTEMRNKMAKKEQKEALNDLDAIRKKIRGE